MVAPIDSGYIRMPVKLQPDDEQFSDEHMPDI